MLLYDVTFGGTRCGHYETILNTTSYVPTNKKSTFTNVNLRLGRIGSDWY